MANIFTPSISNQLWSAPSSTSSHCWGCSARARSSQGDRKNQVSAASTPSQVHFHSLSGRGSPYSCSMRPMNSGRRRSFQ
jgi:hypothetical protein